jgi:hypothetical protein
MLVNKTVLYCTVEAKNPRNNLPKNDARILIQQKQADWRYEPLIAFFVLMYFQTGMFWFVFLSNPSSFIRCTVWFIRFWSWFDTHDSEWFLGLK